MDNKSHNRTDSERSDDEKQVGSPVVTEAPAGLPEDPDAHLSAEEKAAIVSC